MAAICWLCGIFLLLFLIFQLPLRLVCSFEKKNRIDLYIGPFLLTGKKTEQHRQNKKEKTKEKKKRDKKPKEKIKLTLSDVFSLMQTALSALKDSGRYFCRHLRIDPLSLCVVFAGDDPAGVAETFGIANAAMWSILPKAEELFIIPEPSVHLDMDFEAEKTEVTGKVSAMIRLGSLMMCLLLLAIPFLHWYCDFKKKCTASAKRHQYDQKERNENDGKESTDQ